MQEWNYITVKEYKELKRKAKEYGLPIPWPVQVVMKRKEKEK